MRRQKAIRGHLHILIICAAMVPWLTGCLGYRLGPSNGMEAGERSVSVNYFLNRTPEPGIVDDIMTALRREIQVDGTYNLETHGRGNFVISGEITHLQREAISLNPNRIEASRDLRLTLICDVVVERGNSGDIVYQKTISARSAVRNSGDLNRAEQQAIPEMCVSLSKKIVSLIADGEWEPQPMD